MLASLVPVAGSPADFIAQDGNALEPSLYWIGVNDTAYNSGMDQMLDVDSDYYFTLEANYSLGWSNCEIVVQAWHDAGFAGAGGSAYPAEDDAHRNLAFTILCNVGMGNAAVTYPASPVLEVTTDPPYDTVTWSHPTDPAQDIHRIAIPVWLGSQIREASYGGTAPIGSDFSHDPFIALNNADSWDFSITVRDVLSPSQSNTSYGEFGANPYLNMAVVGNPTCLALPGMVGTLAYPWSNIVYSANSLYWVNVSISDLLLNDDPYSWQWIPANNIALQNIHADASTLNSDISVPTYFSAANTPLQVWGQPASPMPPAGNGLVSAGPMMTDYTDPSAFTDLYWYADIPAATVEGVYWGTITITIEGGGITVIDQSTRLRVYSVSPELWWIGFNETTGEPRLDQTVNTDGWYEFTLEANHTMGWDNCEVIIEAWYDEGQIGGMSQYPIENVANENRAFRISYTPYNGLCQVIYPIGPQVQVGTVTDTELWDYYYDPMQLHHRVEIPVWLGSSLVAADGDGFINGWPPYFHPDPWLALNDPNSWDFRVTVRDIYYPTAFNSSYGEFGLDNRTASFDIPLRTGWNLVSLPLELNNHDVSEVLTSIAGKWSVVKYFDSQDKADPWKTCRPGSSANDLPLIDNSMGLWINVLENCTLTVYGQIPDSTAITLKAGWNLVGYPTLNHNTTVEIALSGTNADIVEAFDPASPNLIAEVGPAYAMKPGEGYWVHVPADTVWAINW